MPTHPEAVRLNLEYYRKAAKALLKAAQLGDAAAIERVARHSSKPEQLALHQAQLTIAREQGFASWPRFRAFLIESRLDFLALVNRFVEAALEDERQARDQFARHPEIAAAGLYPALVLADVERISGADPNAKGGTRNWEPLLYVCFSRIAGNRAAGAARLLLQRGANPNATHTDERWPQWPLSCLFAAAGQNNNPDLARALLDAGANPNDGESLYHSTEHADLACFRLLLARGASHTNPNVLNHMLDREEPEGVRLLLAGGANPKDRNQRGETPLHWAVWRGRSPEIIAALLDAGAEIDARRSDGRTAYALAAQSHQTEAADLLRSRGANTELSDLDRFLAEGGGPPRTGVHPDDYRLLTDMAQHRRVDAVRGLLAVGLPVDALGEHGATALHWACWKGYADLVQILLEHGASITIRDKEYDAPAYGWLFHGLRNCGDRSGDYPASLRLMLAAGAIVNKSDMPTGDPVIDAILREHGLLP